MLHSKGWTRTLIAITFILWSAACGSDTEDPGTPNCGVNERFNAVSGECVPINVTPFPDVGSPSDMDEEPADMGLQDPDLPPNPFIDMPADVSDSERCAPGIDSDQDLLDNACECTLGTDPARPDTDGDGRIDGLEDRNANCRVDPGETDPRSPDTDGDGLNDQDELDANTDPLDPDTDNDNVLDGAEVASGCMDPRNADTDGDSLPDGIEDFNQDGMLGTCMNRVFTLDCAGAESDPCKADSDGDNTPDNEEAQYLGCTDADTQNLVDPQLLTSTAGNYKLSLELGVPTGPIPGLNAHAFNDATYDYAGFIASLPKPSGAGSPEALEAHVLSEIRTDYPSATQRASGRRTLTHDGYRSVVASRVALSGGLRPDTVRNTILGELGGVATPNPGLSGSFSNTGASDPVLVIFQVIERPSRYIVVAAAVPESTYSNAGSEAGFRVDDLTGGTSVAESNKLLEDACVSYRVDTRPKVDFIWVLDGSGSMSEEINAVKQFAQQFASILQASNLDFRLAVASGTCNAISNDSAISPEISGLFGSGFSGTCPSIPTFTPVLPNGTLCSKNGANFTTDVQKFVDCVDELDPNNIGLKIAGEHTVTMGTAAIDRALPRSDTDNTKIRPDAAVVIISVTDEFDEHIQQKMGWRDAGQSGEPPNDPTLSGFNSNQLDTETQPFIDYFLRPDIGATVFGIYWIPGQPCPGDIAAEAAAGIHRIVNRTGGSAGNVCAQDISATLEQIATASAGLASGLRLRGTPAAPSINVTVGQARTGNVVTVDRSRADGWDFDGIVNRVTFQGPNPPQTGDRVVIAYRRWEGSERQCTTSADCPPEQKYICRDGVCI